MHCGGMAWVWTQNGDARTGTGATKRLASTRAIMILARDALIVGPLALLLAAQAFRLRVNPAFAVFAGIVVLHGAIATFNLHTTLPAIYGAKLLVNVLFGFIAGRQLMQPSRRILLVIALVWL